MTSDVSEVAPPKSSRSCAGCGL